MTKPIGVIIVTFNSESTIEEALKSLSDIPEVGTIVVVDNASSDATLQRVDPRRVTVLRNPANLGFGKACNQAARELVEPYIAFVNPDACAQPDTFAILLAALEKAGAETFGVGPALLNQEGERERSARRFPTVANALFNWRYRQVFPRTRSRAVREFLMLDADLSSTFACDWVSGAFVLCRASEFRMLNGFDESYFLYYEDIDLFRRARERGQSAHFVGGATAYHAIGGSSKGVSLRAGWWRIQSFMRYYRKFLRKGIGTDFGFAMLLLAGVGLEILFRLRRRRSM